MPCPPAAVGSLVAGKWSRVLRTHTELVAELVAEHVRRQPFCLRRFLDLQPVFVRSREELYAFTRAEDALVAREDVRKDERMEVSNVGNCEMRVRNQTGREWSEPTSIRIEYGGGYVEGL